MRLFAKRSLFAHLSRLPWWLSLLVAAALFMLVRQFLPDAAAAASTLPLLGIAGYAAWLQSRVPDPEHVASGLADMRALSWQAFSAGMEAAFRSDGYAVTALARSGADFELRKGGRVALAGCKRWKVAQTGVEPLRELLQAKEAAGAHDCIYVTAGELSQNARRFAEENKMRLICEADLVQLFVRGKSGKGG
jgi:restriction system protein